MKIATAALISLLAFTPISSNATDINFSIGGGLPFVFVPEVSLITKDNEQRWYLNYKASLDHGISAGFEHSITANNKHAMGIVLGTIGLQDDPRQCQSNENDSLTDSIAEIFGCALAESFDEEVVNGLGISYSYNFNGLSNSGVQIRTELGYGEGRNSKEKSTRGGIIVSYQF